MPAPDFATTTIDRDAGQWFTPLRRALGVETLGINAIVLRPGERSRIHRHERQEEIYLVLEGELTLVIEGTDHVLGPDTVTRVGPATRRQVANTSAARVVLVVLGSAGEPHQSRDALAWTSWDEGGDGRPPQEVPLPGDLGG